MAAMEQGLLSGFRLATFGDIDSTNSEAMRRAHAGAAGRLWIMAERQLAGRGRHGRVWVSEPGNLYSSVLLRPSCAPAVAATLSFVASLALFEAVARVAPLLAPKLSLKWPNDVLCGGAKLAGILLESEVSADGHTMIVIGIGANCAHHPDGAEYPTTDLAREGMPLPPRHLFDTLEPVFAGLHAVWADGAGFGDIRTRWLAHAAGLGGPITVNRPSGTLSGTFQTLDESGALVLDTAHGERKITAGEVFLGPT